MKKFLICLSLLFSVLICDKVHAYYSQGGVVYNEEKIESIYSEAFPNANIDLANSYLVCSYYSNLFECRIYDRPVSLTKKSTSSYYTTYNVSYGNFSYRFAYNTSTKTISSKQTSSNGNTLNVTNNHLYTNFDITVDGNVRSANLIFNKIFNVNFHLNGGILAPGGAAAGVSIPIVNDFTEELNSSNVNDYINALNPVKEMFVFDGWYYDNKFTNAYNPNDNITSEIDLYAKWRYESVDDFLANTNFNEYTFDTSYDYAIITRQNILGDIYLGINSNRYDITVYEYIENLSSYDNEKGFCLVPIYSKNNIYYYNLDTTTSTNTEILVLPKTAFENNDYNFFLTNNAYVSYTNDLSQVEIVDSNGNHITTDLHDTYNHYQESMINNEEDLITIFKKLSDLKDNNIFNNINEVWNKFKTTPIYKYLIILIVGSLIILIIKAAKRK